MAYTPSVRTEANGSTTVDNGLTAGNVQTPSTVANPTDAPILAAVVPDGVNSFALVAGTYGVSYVWGAQAGYSNESPEVALTVDGSKAISVTIPAVPDGATAALIYTDNAMGNFYRFSGVAIGPSDPLTAYLPVVNESDFLSEPLVPSDNSTGLLSVIRAFMSITGGLQIGMPSNFDQEIAAGRSVTEWGASAVPLQPAITGALSAVTDAAVKDVLTSILAVLVNKGSASDGTT